MIAALLAALACSSPPRSPFFGDERFLVLGVDPESEANALAEQMGKRGFHETLRVRGRDFTALGFTPITGITSNARVRVITRRGIALSLDSVEATMLDAAERFGLLSAPLLDSDDGDGDGFEEIYVLRSAPPATDSCILVYRVRDSGFVDPVPGAGYALVRAPDVNERAWQRPFCDDGGSQDGGTAVADAATPAATKPANDSKSVPKDHAQ